ncbi:PTS sugar transporter subunit IIA [bacterium]|nr:PTS sugar transporter subunit IIA [bacterium]
MNLEELIPSGAVNLNLAAEKEHEVLDELAHLIVGQPGLPTNAQLLSAIFNRELEYEAAVGSGVAIPHLMLAGTNKPILAVGRSDKPISFGKKHSEDVRLFFLLISPVDDHHIHLRTISKIARLVNDKAVRDSLLAAKDEKLLRRIIEVHG